LWLHNNQLTSVPPAIRELEAAAAKWCTGSVWDDL
jgi:hypothetical protein